MAAVVAAFAAALLAQAPSFDTDLEAVLGVAGLTPATARFDQNLNKLFVTPQYPTPLFEASFENPWRIPFFASAFRNDLASAFETPSDSLNAGFRMLGNGTRRTLLGDPIQSALDASKEPGALGDALAQMKAAGIIKGDIPSLVGVPLEVQQAASVILRTTQSAVSYRRQAVRGLGNVEQTYQYLLTVANQDLFGEQADRLRNTEKSFDLTAMGAAAHDLTRAAQAASELVAKVDATAKYRFEVETLWGTVRLCGGTGDVHPEKATLLIIDTGGKDRYLNQPRTSASANWTSFVIDAAGDDQYLSDDRLATTEIPLFGDRRSGGAAPGPAGALLGVATLIDRAGNDIYRTHRPGLGAGRFGVATVLDLTGDDVYDAYRDSQGFGHFGAGLLQDVEGDDRYAAFTQSQGCGLTKGFGYLVDRMGGDRYLANTQLIDFASPQDAKQNVSMSQGAATGRRADYSDGNSLSGGIGLLFDARGDDQYECGVFGQGVGYWQGVGMLWDGAGNDQYRGAWYVQGAAAHYAIGFLQDDEGNDRFTATLNMAQGAGHDFSVGFLLDRAGDDVHLAPNLSLGAGNANGIGIFCDVSGSDVYEATGLTMGKAAEAPKNSLRARALTLGVFMDLFGLDKYPTAAVHAGDARRVPTWTDRALRPSESQVGVFFDR